MKKTIRKLTSSTTAKLIILLGVGIAVVGGSAAFFASRSYAQRAMSNNPPKVTLYNSSSPSQSSSKGNVTDQPQSLADFEATVIARGYSIDTASTRYAGTYVGWDTSNGTSSGSIIVYLNGQDNLLCYAAGHLGGSWIWIRDKGNNISSDTLWQESTLVDLLGN